MDFQYVFERNSKEIKTCLKRALYNLSFFFKSKEHLPVSPYRHHQKYFVTSDTREQTFYFIFYFF